MKYPLQFTIDAAPNSEWRVRMIVHKNRKQFLKHASDSGYLAFCRKMDHRKAVHDKDCVIAEIHMSRGENMKLRYIVHECLHALMAYVNISKLRVVSANYDGEEWLASSLEHMVDGILWFLKKNKIKIL